MKYAKEFRLEIVLLFEVVHGGNSNIPKSKWPEIVIFPRVHHQEIVIFPRIHGQEK
jgi:hypothetical protein